MAKKAASVFFCQKCGYESVKWMGQCPGCREWNTFVEESVVTGAGKSTARTRTASSSRQKPTILSEISLEEEDRMSTHMEELDRVLGGGLVRGSLTLVGGDPGIGKSTLLLQVCRNLAADNREVYYVSGEESLKQIKLRANRIGEFNSHLKLLCETELEEIRESVQRAKPDVVVIDSIQTMYQETISSAPGSVSQVREATALLLQLAKGLNIAVFIVGHVTKEGTVAGPRVLEHMVDTVLYFEGDRYAAYRVLRGVKNRFGATNEIGVFEMASDGLREVANPSEYMLGGKPESASGSAVVCSLEGTRPMLLEIQALVCHSSFGIPRRQATGTDFNRVNLLIAVLEKRLGIQMGNCDAYVNLAGGMKVQEPAIDLGIALALVSSFKNRVIDPKTVIIGEVGLSGEVRGVNMAQTRVQEAKKLGFTTCILPAVNAESVKEVQGIKLYPVATLEEAVSLL